MPCVSFDHIDGINQWRDLITVRSEAIHRTLLSQAKQKQGYGSKYKLLKKYHVGDLIMIRNFENASEVFKKLLPQFKSSYEVTQTLINDRYKISDPSNCQNSQRPYVRIW